ncbi:MAG TPA: DJ-1/PfpI family protein [Candidatus Sulfotelmatobacter sp.]|nr:DJ-1/PfpI family protein [Candidatus Sulfotelmatobacter sp.]
MATAALEGMRVAILVSDGFEESELLEPKWALEHAGAATFVISPELDRVKGWSRRHDEKQVPIDIPLDSAKPEDFHALLLPGSAMNPVSSHTNKQEVQFVKHFVDSGKPIAAIGDGSKWMPQTGVLGGRSVTSGPGIKSVVERAGAKWVDSAVVRDGTLLTSRGPEDIPAFNDEMIRLFSEVRERSTHMRKFY